MSLASSELRSGAGHGASTIATKSLPSTRPKRRTVSRSTRTAQSDTPDAHGFEASPGDALTLLGFQPSPFPDGRVVKSTATAEIATAACGRTAKKTPRLTIP